MAVPVIAVGKIASREVAESILQEGKADLVALGRPLIADPDWPRKLAEGRDEEIVGCLWDNVGCLRDFIHRGLPIHCIQNAEGGASTRPGRPGQTDHVTLAIDIGPLPGHVSHTELPATVSVASHVVGSFAPPVRTW